MTIAPPSAASDHFTQRRQQNRVHRYLRKGVQDEKFGREQGNFGAWRLPRALRISYDATGFAEGPRRPSPMNGRSAGGGNDAVSHDRQMAVDGADRRDAVAVADLAGALRGRILAEPAGALHRDAGRRQRRRYRRAPFCRQTVRAMGPAGRGGKPPGGDGMVAITAFLAAHDDHVLAGDAGRRLSPRIPISTTSCPTIRRIWCRSRACPTR